MKKTLSLIVAVVFITSVAAASGLLSVFADSGYVSVPYGHMSVVASTNTSNASKLINGDRELSFVSAWSADAVPASVTINLTSEKFAVDSGTAQTLKGLEFSSIIGRNAGGTPKNVSVYYSNSMPSGAVEATDYAPAGLEGWTLAKRADLDFPQLSELSGGSTLSYTGETASLAFDEPITAKYVHIIINSVYTDGSKVRLSEITPVTTAVVAPATPQPTAIPTLNPWGTDSDGFLVEYVNLSGFNVSNTNGKNLTVTESLPYVIAADQIKLKFSIMYTGNWGYNDNYNKFFSVGTDAAYTNGSKTMNIIQFYQNFVCIPSSTNTSNFVDKSSGIGTPVANMWYDYEFVLDSKINTYSCKFKKESDTEYKDIDALGDLGGNLSEGITSLILRTASDATIGLGLKNIVISTKGSAKFPTATPGANATEAPRPTYPAFSTVKAYTDTVEVGTETDLDALTFDAPIAGEYNKIAFSFSNNGDAAKKINVVNAIGASETVFTVEKGETSNYASFNGSLFNKPIIDNEWYNAELIYNKVIGKYDLYIKAEADEDFRRVGDYMPVGITLSAGTAGISAETADVTDNSLKIKDIVTYNFTYETITNVRITNEYGNLKKITFENAPNISGKLLIAVYNEEGQFKGMEILSLNGLLIGTTTLDLTALPKKADTDTVKVIFVDNFNSFKPLCDILNVQIIK